MAFRLLILWATWSHPIQIPMLFSEASCGEFQLHFAAHLPRVASLPIFLVFFSLSFPAGGQYIVLISTILFLANHIVYNINIASGNTTSAKDPSCRQKCFVDGSQVVVWVLQVIDLYDPKEQWASYVINAIKAKEFQVKDVNYIVRKGEVPPSHLLSPSLSSLSLPFPSIFP